MLTLPMGVSMIFGTSEFPVPPADWYMFSTLAQAQQVICFGSEEFPNCKASVGRRIVGRRGDFLHVAGSESGWNFGLDN